MIMSALRLMRDRRGVGTIEFAMVAPVLASLVMGITDLSMGVAHKFELDQACYRALEMVTVGSLQSDYAYVRPEAAAAAGELEANVTVNQKLECNNVAQASFSGACPAGQQVARFVEVVIVSDFEPLFTYGPFQSALLTDGKVRMTSRATLRVQ
jgi:Flp pilus assembly pilin Flp